MRYNEEYKVLFKFNPLMQAITGKFKGYMLVMDAITNSRIYNPSVDVVEMVYNQSSWNKLIKHINKIIK